MDPLGPGPHPDAAAALFAEVSDALQRDEIRVVGLLRRGMEMIEGLYQCVAESGKG